jgi:hypothetical protein
MGRDYYKDTVEIIKNSNCDREERIMKEVNFFAWEKLDNVEDIKNIFGLR